MAKPKTPEQERPQHDEYVENFQALTNGLKYADEINHFEQVNRTVVIAQVDHLLDKHAVDYPEIVIGYQLGRLATEVEGILV